MNKLPKISRRQAYVYKPLHELFNNTGLDDFIPSRKSWFGLHRKLWYLTNRLVWNEGKRLQRKNGNTTYSNRKGIKGLL